MKFNDVVVITPQIPKTPENEKPLVLLIVPPFFPPHTPSIAVSLLKASLEQKGILCRVIYANILFAEIIGIDLFGRISGSSTKDLLGECIFAPVAYDGEVQQNVEQFSLTSDSEMLQDNIPEQLKYSMTHADCLELQEKCKIFLDQVVEEISLLQPIIIGFSNSYQQTNPSIAIAKALKKVLPETIFVMGGKNCSDVMGEEIASSVKVFDYIFHGEADFEFADFCWNYCKFYMLPERKIIECRMPHDLNELPMPDYTDYFNQLAGQENKCVGIPFESSRGCWWGETQRCKFCSDTVTAMIFREKKSETVLRELKTLQGKYPQIQLYYATDSVFPRSFHDTFLTKLSADEFKKQLVYQVKANLTHNQLRAMKLAGITHIQPGIESLSTRLLRMMNKGETAASNIRFLRDCIELGINANWNILIGFPYDKVSDYEEQAKLIPFITHLHPPLSNQVVIQRFSPYYEESKEYGLKNIRPVKGYINSFPDYINIDKLAFFFEADFPSESLEDPTILETLHEQIRTWQNCWMKNPVPGLWMKRISPYQWLVEDTRNVSVEPSVRLNKKEFSLLNNCSIPVNRNTIKDDATLERLLHLAFLLEVDDKLVSVVCNSA